MTSEQYRVLSALRDGRAHTLWPMMRRSFLRQQWIKPNGEPPSPSEKRRAVAPVRPFVVTRRGKAALRAYERELKQSTDPAPDGARRRGPLRMLFGADDPRSA